MKAYLSRLEAQGKLTTIEAGGYAIREFIAISGATFADEVTEDTILRWYNALRRKGNSDRTRFNKHTYLFTFFRWMKLDTKSLAEHPPDFTEREVSIYSPEELKALFASLPEGGLKLAFETLLQAGLRETELTHLTWERVDFAARRILVREYDQEGAMVRIKDRDERSVPISIELAAKLAAWKLARPGTNLVFGTKGDLPDGKLLRALKRAANRAGLECGRCPGCRSKTKECRRWTLKRFRSTCTTTLLRSGLDVRTVMSIVGHADLETTMKYLAVANQDSTLSKIDQIAWT